MGGSKLGLVALALLLGAAVMTACGEKTIEVPHTAPAGVVAFDPDAAVAANGVIPNKVEVKPVCGSDTTTFGTELVNTPPNKATVNFEWGAIAEDTAAEELNAKRAASSGASTDLPFRAIKEPKRMAVAGTVQDFQLSTGDLQFNHPYGLDMTMDIKPDPPYAFSALKLGTGADEDGPPEGTIHIEIQQGLVPHSGTGLQDFLSGYEPQNGDRIAAFGPWIIDCGHDDWHSELHELTFLAFGHPEGTTTVAHAFYNPYLQSQYLTANPDIAPQINDYARWTDPTVKVFGQYLYQELLRVGHAQRPYHNHIESHHMLSANLLAPPPWDVCAPGSGSKLTYSYNFTVRPGVSITAVPNDELGCVRFTTKITSQYLPQTPLRKDCLTPWSELNAQLQAALGNPDIDIRKLIESQVPKSFIPAVERDPTNDCYDPLQASAVAAGSGSRTITTSDTQAYPFYGEAKVGWAS
jgi:hypothetical protein